MGRSKLIKQREMSDTAAVLIMVAVVSAISLAYVLLVNLVEPKEPDLSLCPFCDQPVRH